jgi:hypothetical protein
MSRLTAARFIEATTLARCAGSLDAADPYSPAHVSDRWELAKEALGLHRLNDADDVALMHEYEAAFRTSSGYLRTAPRRPPGLPVAAAPGPHVDDEPTVEAPENCRVGPGLARTRPAASGRWSRLRRLIGLGVLACVGCGGSVEPAMIAPPIGASHVIDAGADCHATYTYHSTWPIRCDDAGNCMLVDAGTP